MDHRIEYRLQRGADVEHWAQHAGTRPQARESALRLLRDLRETWPRAQVFLDGHRIDGERKERDA